jgi:hypothetical protein
MPISLTANWDEIPHTHSTAVPTSMRYVLDSPSIRLVDGRIRGATVSGIFELANVAQYFDDFNGNRRVQVKVGWFGAKPRTTWTHIILGDEWELLPNFTGEVVHNIST